MKRADEIDLDDGLETIRRQLLRRAYEISCGAGDNDAERAELRRRRVRRRFHRVIVANVRGETGDARAVRQGAEALDRRVHLLLLAAQHRDIRPGADIGLGDREVNAAGAARDKRGFSFKQVFAKCAHSLASASTAGTVTD